MTSSRALFVRVLVIRQGDQWLAQGLDYNVATQAPTDQLAIKSFVRIFRARIKRDVEMGLEPLQGIAEAPAQFEALWKRLEGQGRTKPLTPAMTEAEAKGIPPAYILEAVGDGGSELTN